LNGETKGVIWGGILLNVAAGHPTAKVERQGVEARLDPSDPLRTPLQPGDRISW
jgi:hypothetical protein